MLFVRRTVLWGAFLALSLTAPTSTAFAELIVNVDFGHTNSGLYSGTGVLGTGTSWNEITSFSGSDLIADDGSTNSGFGFSATGAVLGSNVPGADLDLFDDYFHNNGSGSIDITVNNLSNTKLYRLIIFGAQAPLDRGGTFTIDAVSQSTTGDITSTFAVGDNYVSFTNISPTGGEIAFSVTNGTEGIGILNGFQIQVVPEPSSFAMMGLGLLGLGWRRRKRE